MRNLEAVEQKCLSYLKQIANPLAPIATLLSHLQQEEDTADVTSGQLVDLLRKHELFRVMEAPFSLRDAASADGPEAGDCDVGLYAILCTRVPTERQLAEMLLMQLETMREALKRALAEARDSGQHDRAQEIMRTMARVDVVQEQFDKVAPPHAGEEDK